MVYGTYNYSIHGVYKPSYITGGPHIVDDFPMNKQPLSELVSRLQNLEAQIHGVLEAPRITSQIRLCLQIRPSEINRNHIISHYKWWFSIVMLVYQRVIFNISMVFTAILWDLSPLSSKNIKKSHAIHRNRLYLMDKSKKSIK